MGEEPVRRHPDHRVQPYNARKDTSIFCSCGADLPLAIVRGQEEQSVAVRFDTHLKEVWAEIDAFKRLIGELHHHAFESVLCTERMMELYESLDERSDASRQAFLQGVLEHLLNECNRGDLLQMALLETGYEYETVRDLNMRTSSGWAGMPASTAGLAADDAVMREIISKEMPAVVRELVETLGMPLLLEALRLLGTNRATVQHWIEGATPQRGNAAEVLRILLRVCRLLRKAGRSDREIQQWFRQPSQHLGELSPVERLGSQARTIIRRDRLWRDPHHHVLAAARLYVQNT